MRGPDSLERSQRKLYLFIKSELALYEKKKRNEILGYERAFHANLPASMRISSRKELFRAIRSSSAVLVGDFHPFRQSQKGFLRLVEECSDWLARPVLALECLQQGHQVAVNEYLNGYITLEELRDKIDFEHYWPFSWENYREILALARQHKLPVLALNILERRRNSSMLRERDRAAAERISAELNANPNSCVFVLYGELHLARPHLPADLRGKLPSEFRVLTVHQNEPDLYWKAPKLRNGQKPEVLRLGADEFCILNSVPWVKLRSYLDWLEGSPSSNEWEELDTAGTVHQYAKLLAEAIGVRSSIRDEVEIFSPDRLVTGLPTAFRKKLCPADAALASHSLRFQRTAYLPTAGAILLPVVSTNSLSEAASWLLWHSCRSEQGSARRRGSREWIAQFLVGYLGSKVLNPKRKCNEVEDLRELPSGVSRRAMALLKPYLKGERLKGAAPLPARREIEACRLAGYVLAERFFLALLMKPELHSLLRTWFERFSASSTRFLLAETSAKAHSVAPSRKRDRF